MKPMNELLADIVVASGGTVTSYTRNGLLRDWLEAVSALAFAAQPQSTTVDEYSTASFGLVVAGGTAPYSYQWKKNGTNIGTNSASLSFATTATDNAASVTCVVTDGAGSVITSDAAVLGVTSYVYQFDGVTQLAQLSSIITIPESADFEVEFFVNSLTNSGHAVSNNAASGSSRVGFGFSDKLVITTSTVTDIAFVTSLPLVNKTISIKRLSGVFSASSDGVALSPSGSVTDNGAFSVNNFAGKRASGTSITALNGQMKSVKVWTGGDRNTGALTNQIPLNNKSQGANQLATVGSVNATIVNYNESGWVAI